MTDRDSDLSGVIESSMCIGCGVCVFADPTLDLQLHPKKLIFEPTHPGNAAAASVCPAVSVDFPGLHEALFPGEEAGIYGVVHSVMLSQSTNLDRNLKASSGGLIKEILIELLKAKDVDGAIVLRHVEGLDFEPQLIYDPEEVDSLPGSIYHNLPKSKVLEILRERDGRFVVVAIPCELEGLYQYILKLEPHLLERIHTTIGLLCGWQYNWHSVAAISSYKGIEPDSITDVSYRGDGPIGRLQITTSDSKIHTTNRRIDFGYQVAFDRTFNTPRCHLCVNHANFLADIVVGDAWLQSTLTSKTGVSLIINRRKESHDLMMRLTSSGRVVTTEVTVNEIRESQKPRIAFGDFAYAYADYLEELGLHRPEMLGPNRPAATLVPHSEVARFHRELNRKLELQWERRYRYLFWRKATKEIGKFVGRYLDWFRHRVLRAGRDKSASDASTERIKATFR